MRLILFIKQPKAGLRTMQYIAMQCIHESTLYKTKATKLKRKSKPTDDGHGDVSPSPRHGEHQCQCKAQIPLVASRHDTS